MQNPSLPFREQILADKIFTIHDVYKTMLSFSRFAQKNNMICPRSQFCTCYDVIYITYLNRFRRKPAILVSFVFH